MPVEEELYLTGTGRAQSIYQQPSTGEKHVLFYPTSPAPSLNSDERRSWSQASSSAVNNTTANHKNTNNNQETPRMKKSEGTDSNPPDSGGTQENQNNKVHSESRYFKIGIYGWRKRCLYILILALLVMVIINLALTLWVLKVMEFSSHGMGQLRIVAGGLRLEGRAFVLDALIASTIRSRAGQPIVIESSKNFTITTRDASGVLDNRIFLGNDRFECLTDNFKVINTKGAVLFSADHKEVVLGVDALRVTGDGGTIFSGSVQTPLVRAESGHDLRLESPTRSLEMHAPMGINMESRAGDIKLMSLNDIQLKSVAGQIRLESGSVFMPMLPSATSSSRSSPIRNHEIFQVCVCENGKLFLSPPHSICAVSEDQICR